LKREILCKQIKSYEVLNRSFFILLQTFSILLSFRCVTHLYFLLFAQQ